MKICSVEGCGRPAGYKNICRMHYQREWNRLPRVKQKYKEYYEKNAERIATRNKMPEAVARILTYNKTKGNILKSRYKKTEKGKASERRSTLFRKYNVTEQQYDDMIKRQLFFCVICTVHRETVERGRLHVDHDHRTGKVRQLLCRKCNVALGFFEDNPKIIERALAYIIRHKI